MNTAPQVIITEQRHNELLAYEKAVVSGGVVVFNNDGPKDTLVYTKMEVIRKAAKTNNSLLIENKSIKKRLENLNDSLDEECRHNMRLSEKLDASERRVIQLYDLIKDVSDMFCIEFMWWRRKYKQGLSDKAKSEIAREFHRAKSNMVRRGPDRECTDFKATDCAFEGTNILQPKKP